MKHAKGNWLTTPMKYIGISKLALGVIVVVSVLIALSTSLVYINGLGISAQPPGPLSWLAQHGENIDAYGFRHQGGRDCSVGVRRRVNFARGGWPVRFNYANADILNCQGGFYPIAYLADVLIFSGTIYVLVRGVKELKRHGLMTKGFILAYCVILVAAVELAIGSARVAVLREQLSPPAGFSSIEDDQSTPFPLPYCATFNKTVNEECVRRLSDPYYDLKHLNDQQTTLYGWPVAYEYEGDMLGSSGTIFYPLAFIADAFGVFTVLFVLVIISYKFCRRSTHA